MRVRVASLNVWALPGIFCEDVDRRMDAIGERLQSLPLDVIGFQEAWTSDARETLIEAGRRAGFRHAAHETESLGGSGLVTLSRLPIEAVRFEQFSIRGHPDKPSTGEYLSGKGFLSADLATPDGLLTVVNTHLHARYARLVSHGFRAHRTAQLIQLASRLSRATGPLIVLGDFNFEEGQPEHEIFTGIASVRDVAIELDHRFPTVDGSLYYRRTSKKHDRRVDMIFVRDGEERGLRPIDVGRTFDELLDFDGRPGGYSNHAALFAEIELLMVVDSADEPFAQRAGEVAARLLAEGRQNAERRQSKGRSLSMAGLTCALLAGAGLRGRPISRRRLLRNSLRGAALLALAPSIGSSIVAEVFVPDEIDAFEKASAQLAQLESRSRDELAANVSAEGDTASALPSPRS